MKSPRIALPAPTPRSLRLAASLALFGFAGVTGACKMSPAMEARRRTGAARDSALPAPATPVPGPAAVATPPPPASPPAAPPPVHLVATPAPLPPTAPPGAPKSADRGERTLGPTPIGQMAPEEAPPIPTGR